MQKNIIEQVLFIVFVIIGLTTFKLSAQTVY